MHVSALLLNGHTGPVSERLAVWSPGIISRQCLHRDDSIQLQSTSAHSSLRPYPSKLTDHKTQALALAPPRQQASALAVGLWHLLSQRPLEALQAFSRLQLHPLAQCLEGLGRTQLKVHLPLELGDLGRVPA